MSNAIFNLEILPGTVIFDACYEACRIARQLDVNVRIKFNGKTLIAKPTSRPENLEAEYHKRWK